MNEYKATGKFLITGEYLVLHGARSLAVPLLNKYQTLTVQLLGKKEINWDAYDEKNQRWLSVRFSLPYLDIISSSNQELGTKLLYILEYIQQKRPELFNQGLILTTRMNFSPTWGMGSSSTLITLLAEWASIDPYELQRLFFNGSGYDVACAKSPTPLIYNLYYGKPVITPVEWNPPYKKNLYFLYLGQKQDSREAMAQFKRQSPKPFGEDIEKINKLTKRFLHAETLFDFQKLMKDHESLIAKLIKVQPVKELLFQDFEGEIKSLGGWGGDFVMVASESNPEAYFNSKGYSLIFKWEDLF